MLNDNQKKEAIKQLESYKFLFCCKKCGIVYGSDFDKDSGICMKCSNYRRRK